MTSEAQLPIKARAEIAFRGRLHFCSNFYPKGMWMDGLWFHTREHAFQWGKFTDPIIQAKIRAAMSALGAKEIARVYKQVQRPDWQSGYSIVHMKYVVRTFFGQWDQYRDKLLATGDEHLEERNNWGDMFWGTVKGKGRNELGKILMEVREELRSAGTQNR